MRLAVLLPALATGLAMGMTKKQMFDMAKDTDQTVAQNKNDDTGKNAGQGTPSNDQVPLEISTDGKSQTQQGGDNGQQGTKTDDWGYGFGNGYQGGYSDSSSSSGSSKSKSSSNSKSFSKSDFRGFKRGYHYPSHGGYDGYGDHHGDAYENQQYGYYHPETTTPPPEPHYGHHGPYYGHGYPYQGHGNGYEDSEDEEDQGYYGSGGFEHGDNGGFGNQGYPPSGGEYYGSEEIESKAVRTKYFRDGDKICRKRCFKEGYRTACHKKCYKAPSKSDSHSYSYSYSKSSSSKSSSSKSKSGSYDKHHLGCKVQCSKDAYGQTKCKKVCHGVAIKSSGSSDSDSSSDSSSSSSSKSSSSSSSDSCETYKFKHGIQDCVKTCCDGKCTKTCNGLTHDEKIESPNKTANDAADVPATKKRAQRKGLKKRTMRRRRVGAAKKRLGGKALKGKKLGLRRKKGLKRRPANRRTAS